MNIELLGNLALLIGAIAFTLWLGSRRTSPEDYYLSPEEIDEMVDREDREK